MSAVDKNIIMEEKCERTGCAAEFCYLAFLSVMAALKALGFYEGQPVFTVFMVLACTFLLFKILLTDHTGIEYLVILLFLVTGGLVYLNTGEKSLLINLMVLVGIKGVDVRKVIKVFLSVWGSCYVILTALTLIGIHSDTLFLHDKRGIGLVLCHSLGYSHSNVLHINYLCISAMVLYLAADRFTKRQRMALLAILTALDIYVFLYSLSFTGLLGTLALYIIYLYMTLREHLARFERILVQLLLPFCILFSLIGPLVITGRLFDIINSALNTRFNLTRWFLTNQPITLFGTRFDTPSSDYTLDCSYSYLFMQLGVIPFTILILLYLGTIHQLIKRNRLAELSVILGLCIAGVAEPFLFNLGFKNISFVFVGEYLYDLIRQFEGKFSIAQHGYILICGKDIDRFCWLKIPERIGSTLCHIGKRVLEIWMCSWKKYCLTCAAVCLLMICAVRICRKPVEAVYINTTVHSDDYDGVGEIVYLSDKDIDSILSEGNLVYDFRGEDKPMLVYFGTAADIEYWRIAISCGFWCAMVVICLLGAAETRSAAPSAKAVCLKERDA